MTAKKTPIMTAVAVEKTPNTVYLLILQIFSISYQIRQKLIEISNLWLLILIVFLKILDNIKIFKNKKWKKKKFRKILSKI